MELERQPEPEAGNIESPIRNHGKIDPNRLSPDTRVAIMHLQQCLAREPGMLRAQVTFDDIHGDKAGHDDPPTVHAIVDPDPAAEWPLHWFGPNTRKR